MMDERTTEALARTWKHLVRHLEDLNDEVDQADGRIKDHMVVDGMKDCVKTIRCIRELVGGGAHEEEDGTTDGSGSSGTDRMSAVSALR